MADEHPAEWLLQYYAGWAGKIFGGGKDKAKSAVEVTGNKFALFRPSNSLAPNWGRPIYDALSDSYK
jgi:hypothetical protein